MEGDSICESRTSHTGPINKKRKTTNTVSQPENANTADSHPVKDPSPFRFTWRIDRFSQMNTTNLYSDVFEVGGYKWRVLVFPKGCNEVDYMSMFLDVADSENLPIGWSCNAQFSLTVVNQINNKDSVRKDPNLGEQLLQELRDIAFKEDLVEKMKQGLALNVSFNAVKEKIDANADLFSSYQLEQVSTIVNLVNNIVRMFEELENLKKEKDSAKKITDQDNEALKETRQKILTSKTSLTNHQTQLNSLDVEIADFKAKLEKLEGNREKIVEIQNQEKDKITSLNNEVKSIFYRLVDDKIKLKSVEDKIPGRQTELESHEKLYQIFKATPPF